MIYIQDVIYGVLIVGFIVCAIGAIMMVYKKKIHGAYVFFFGFGLVIASWVFHMFTVDILCEISGKALIDGKCFSQGIDPGGVKKMSLKDLQDLIALTFLWP